MIFLILSQLNMVFSPVCETKRKTRQESILDHLFTDPHKFRQKKISGQNWMILVILLIRLGALAEISTRIFILRTKRANRDLLIAPNTFTTRLHDFLLISLYWTFIIQSQILKKMLLATLNGFFVTREWMEKLPKTHLIGLPKPVSDHSLFTIDTCLLKGDPTPFKIKNMWLQHKV